MATEDTASGAIGNTRRRRQGKGPRNLSDPGAPAMPQTRTVSRCVDCGNAAAASHRTRSASVPSAGQNSISCRQCAPLRSWPAVLSAPSLCPERISNKGARNEVHISLAACHGGARCLIGPRALKKLAALFDTSSRRNSPARPTRVEFRAIALKGERPRGLSRLS